MAELGCGRNWPEQRMLVDQCVPRGSWFVARVFVPANKDHQKTKDQQPTSKLHPRLIPVGSELFSDEVVVFFPFDRTILVESEKWKSPAAS
ncbi:hypothetical protein K0M31_006386 [Melipona bicolor]|uniref:Uncharacterized protein n=1 Tax=Melipona bicolor TaxID=60889 RepID=A0AA40FTI1_9HYME|nr:hypothetical protein K0M31_006386 [Melipona bicolor]